MTSILHFARRRDTLLIRIATMLLLISCTLVLLSQTAFAQTTYVITDGDRVVVHTTATADPAAVLSEAGLELHQDDLYTTSGNADVSEITVQRGMTVLLTIDGRQTRATAYGETVAELLDRLSISVDDQTEVSVPLDTVTSEGLAVTVSQTVTASETYTVPLPYETVYENDDTLTEGTQALRSAGQNGEMRCTALVTYKNGKEVSRVVTDRTTLTEATPAVIAVGTAPRPTDRNGNPLPIIGDGYLITADGTRLNYTGTMQVEATAYTKTDEGCNDYTATGTLARVGAIAVDPDMIPYGTRMFIVSNDGEYVYGIATAEDCGGAITENRIDLYYDTTAECFQFGRRDCTIYFLA